MNQNWIDPSLIPKRTLYSGEKMPAIGLGTFASDNYPAEQVSNAVYGAVKAGYRSTARAPPPPPARPSPSETMIKPNPPPTRSHT